MTPFKDTMFDEDYWDHVPEVLAAKRIQGPVHQAVLDNGVKVWVITRDADARKALRDPRLSKDVVKLRELMRAQLAEAGHEGEPSDLFGDHMLFRDGAKHARLRKKVAEWFTPQHIGQLKPRIEAISADLIEIIKAEPSDTAIDLIGRYAYPLPIAVICEMIGIPAADRHQFRSWTADLIVDDQEVAVPASEAMAAYFFELIAAKRAQPGDDLLSMLVQDDKHDALSDPELLGTLFLLTVAGHETTTNAIANGARLLLDQPARWRDMAQTPDMIPDAVEELLRFDSPVTMSTHRFTTVEVEVGGVVIPADQFVLVALASANRDGDLLADADELDLRRRPTRHLSFGLGIHHCLGAALARQEIEIALRDLTRQFPNARLAVAPEDLRRTQNSAINNAYRSLPLLVA